MAGHEPPGKAHSGYIISLVLCTVAIGVLIVLSNRYVAFDAADADIKNDWIVASALFDGVNPYSDLDALASRYSNGQYDPPSPGPDYEGTNRTPRTPGAIALGAVWLPIPLSSLVELNNILGALFLIPLIFLVIRNHHHPGWQWISVAVFFSVAMLWSTRFSTISPLVALGSTYAVVGIRDGDKPTGGIALAIAGTLKAFPLILLILAVAYRRWRTFGWAVGSVAVLNLTPFLMPQVRMSDAVDALGGASARYGYLDGNMSLSTLISEFAGPPVGMVVLVLVVAFLAWWIISQPSNVATDSALLVGSAILFSPLSWPHYALVFYPVALLFLLSPTTGRRVKTFALVSMLLAFPTGESWIGAVSVFVVTALAVVERRKIIQPPQPVLASASAR